jgi:hypothetical protein
MRHYAKDSDERDVGAETNGTRVFVVYWMSYDDDGNCIKGFDRDDCSLIGVYSTCQNAEAAIERAKVLPGFRDYPDYFLIDSYELNKDHWTSGFSMG